MSILHFDRSNVWAKCCVQPTCLFENFNMYIKFPTALLELFRRYILLILNDDD